MSRPCSESAARLLVVDHDPSTEIVMKAIFRRCDVIVDCAGDGVAVLARLGTTEYDALIVEPGVPGPLGFDILREMNRCDPSLLEADHRAHRRGRRGGGSGW